MTMRWIFGCVVALALLCCLAVAQFQFQPRAQTQTQTQTQQQKGPKQTPPKTTPPQWAQKQQDSKQQTTQPQKPKPPTYPQHPKPPVFSCEVEHLQKVMCGPPKATPEDCEAIGCCFDGRSCYYGKPVTVQCLKDGRVILVVSRDATLPYTDVDSLSLNGPGHSCTPIDSNSAYLIYQFSLNDCGTVVTSTGNNIMYENRLSSTIDVGYGERGAITRDTYFDLLFQCTYIGESYETIVTEIKLIPSPLPAAAFGDLRVEMRLASGVCTNKGCNEEDAAYTSFYMETDYPVTKVLRDNVYVEVRLLERTDPNLVLTLGRCWATSDPYPHSVPQWDLLINGCPNYEDKYQTVLVPVGDSSGLTYPSHHRRFYFKMFTFVGVSTSDPSKGGAKLPQPPIVLKESVYVHCSTTVCQPSLGDNCEPRCFRTRRDVAGSTQKTSGSDQAVVVTSGEIILLSN